MTTRQKEIRTAYPADRAAALAGVPLSTLHYWARTDLLVPGASEERVKLWSFEDLMGLRIIDWLRGAKGDAQGHDIPRTSMHVIRQALAHLRSRRQELWSAKEGSPVRIDRAGKVYFETKENIRDIRQQLAMGEILDVLAPFEGEGAIVGPDLRRPRPHLRIVPGKLAGEPHVEETRIETRALAALGERGFGVGDILKMYPFLKRPQIEDALDLEAQLAKNLSAA